MRKRFNLVIWRTLGEPAANDSTAFGIWCVVCVECVGGDWGELVVGLLVELFEGGEWLPFKDAI